MTTLPATCQHSTRSRHRLPRRTRTVLPVRPTQGPSAASNGHCSRGWDPAMGSRTLALRRHFPRRHPGRRHPRSTPQVPHALSSSPQLLCDPPLSKRTTNKPSGHRASLASAQHRHRRPHTPPLSPPRQHPISPVSGDSSTTQIHLTARRTPGGHLNRTPRRRHQPATLHAVTTASLARRR